MLWRIREYKQPQAAASESTLFRQKRKVIFFPVYFLIRKKAIGKPPALDPARLGHAVEVAVRPKALRLPVQSVGQIGG